MLNAIVKILGAKPVSDLLVKLTGKLFGTPNRLSPKSAASLSAALIVSILIGLAKYFDPGLGELLAGNEATLVAFVALVAAVIAYYTKDEGDA